MADELPSKSQEAMSLQKQQHSTGMQVHVACDSIAVRQKRLDATAKMKTTIHTFGPALKSHTGKGSPQWLWGHIAKMPTIGEYDAPSFSRPMNDTATRTRPGNPHFFGVL